MPRLRASAPCLRSVPSAAPKTNFGRNRKNAVGRVRARAQSAGHRHVSSIIASPRSTVFSCANVPNFPRTPVPTLRITTLSCASDGLGLVEEAGGGSVHCTHRARARSRGSQTPWHLLWHDDASRGRALCPASRRLAAGFGAAGRTCASRSLVAATARQALPHGHWRRRQHGAGLFPRWCSARDAARLAHHWSRPQRRAPAHAIRRGICMAHVYRVRWSRLQQNGLSRCCRRGPRQHPTATAVQPDLEHRSSAAVVCCVHMVVCPAAAGHPAPGQCQQLRYQKRVHHNYMRDSGIRTSETSPRTSHALLPECIKPEHVRADLSLPFHQRAACPCGAVSRSSALPSRA